MQNEMRALPSSVDRQIRLHERWPALGSNHASLVAGDRNAGGILELAILQTERPVVSRADDAPIMNLAGGEARAGVRAGVVQRVHLTSIQENGKLKPADLDVLPAPLSQLVQLA